MTDAATLTRALGGKWYGRYGLAFCPAHDNRRTPALSLADGTEGRLLATCHAGCTFAAIMDALRGLGLVDGRGLSTLPDPVEQARRRAGEKAETEKRAAQAHRLWQEAEPIAGTLAERYLRARGITCELPPTLRFHAHCWHRDTATKLPAMVAAVSIGRKVVGAHRTYLTEPGVKAFGKESKLMLGRCAGGAVRLSDGTGALLVAKGIETGLALLTGLPDSRPRTWAALSANGVAGLILPRQPGELVLAPDGDAPGREAARKLADRAYAAGWKVRSMSIPDGRDWADMLIAGTAA